MFIADALSRFPSKEKIPEEQFQVNVVGKNCQSPPKNCTRSSVRQVTTKTNVPWINMRVSHVQRTKGQSLNSSVLAVQWQDSCRRYLLLIQPTDYSKQHEEPCQTSCMQPIEEQKDEATCQMLCFGLPCQQTFKRKQINVHSTGNKLRNQWLPMMSHEVPELPWQTVGIDFFCHEGKEYEVIVDFSFHFEIICLKHTTADAVFMFCKVVFATHGLPPKLISDNGPPLNSHKFAEHVTSSTPHQVLTIHVPVGWRNELFKRQRNFLRRLSTHPRGFTMPY